MSDELKHVSETTCRCIGWLDNKRPPVCQNFEPKHSGTVTKISQCENCAHDNLCHQPRYEKLFVGMECDLSQTTLEEAANRLGPSFTYELRVNETQLPYARRLLRTMGADTMNHPFAPYINLVTQPGYRTDEWSIHANDRGYGSEGA